MRTLALSPLQDLTPRTGTHHLDVSVCVVVTQGGQRGQERPHGWLRVTPAADQQAHLDATLVGRPPQPVINGGPKPAGRGAVQGCWDRIGTWGQTPSLAFYLKKSNPSLTFASTKLGLDSAVEHPHLLSSIPVTHTPILTSWCSCTEHPHPPHSS